MDDEENNKMSNNMFNLSKS